MWLEGCSDLRRCEDLSWCLQSRKILHLFSSASEFHTPFLSHSPSVPLLIQSEKDIWFNYRRPIGLILIGLSYFFRVVDWNIYTVRKQKEWWCGWVIQDLFTDSLPWYWLNSTNMGSYILEGQTGKGLLVPATGQEKKVDRIIVGGTLVKSTLAICPWLKQSHENGGVL